MLNYTLPKIPIKDSVSNIEYNQNDVDEVVIFVANY